MKAILWFVKHESKIYESPAKGYDIIIHHCQGILHQDCEDSYAEMENKLAGLIQNIWALCVPVETWMVIFEVKWICLIFNLSNVPSESALLMEIKVSNIPWTTATIGCKISFNHTKIDAKLNKQAIMYSIISVIAKCHKWMTVNAASLQRNMYSHD